MTGSENTVQPNSETVFFTGYAKLPSNITAAKLYEVVAIGVEVDPSTSIIIAVDCTLATTATRDFVNRLIRGYDLSNGIDGLIDRFEKRYYGSARKAIETSLRILYEKWLVYKAEKGDGKIE